MLNRLRRYSVAPTLALITSTILWGIELKRITILRKKRGWSQSELARQIGSSQTQISLLETGVRPAEQMRHGAILALQTIFRLPIKRILADV
jgi:transcriptional regulator with XRE-family HTH domain